MTGTSRSASVFRSRMHWAGDDIPRAVRFVLPLYAPHRLSSPRLFD